MGGEGDGAGRGRWNETWSLGVVGLVGHGCVVFGCCLELGVSAGSLRSYATSVVVFV